MHNLTCCKYFFEVFYSIVHFSNRSQTSYKNNNYITYLEYYLKYLSTFSCHLTFKILITYKIVLTKKCLYPYSLSAFLTWTNTLFEAARTQFPPVTTVAKEAPDVGEKASKTFISPVVLSYNYHCFHVHCLTFYFVSFEQRSLLCEADAHTDTHRQRPLVQINQMVNKDK